MPIAVTTPMRRPTLIPLKNNSLEAALFQQRVIVAGIFVLCMLTLLLLRYFYLEVLQYHTYANLSEANRIHLDAISPPRGYIYDARGRLLADNRPSFTLTVAGSQLTDIPATDALLKQLTPVVQLTPDEIHQFWSAVLQTHRAEQVIVKAHLSSDDIARFEGVAAQYPLFGLADTTARDGSVSRSLILNRPPVPDMSGLIVSFASLSALMQLTPAEVRQFWGHIRLARKLDKVPLRLRMNDEDIARFTEVSYRFAGVDIDVELTRYYPYGDLFAHALGYVSRISEDEQDDLDANAYRGISLIGKSGIEKFYEPILHGHAGFQHVENNAHGKLIKVLSQTPPVRGDDLKLYLDADLQRVAVDALAGRRGAVVAIDPANGGVMAFVSNPGFDPNLFVGGIPYKIYHELATSPDRPLYNRASQGIYPPGSTVKPFEGLGGVQQGLVDWGTTFYDPGSFRLPGDDHEFRDWKHGGHGTVDLHKAIEQSCDVYFYNLADRMGVDHFHDWMQQFGFGQRSGIDLLNEASGNLPSTAWKKARLKAPFYRGEMMSVGIGQGYFTATPLQLALATAMMANKGHPIRPHLLKSVSGPNAYDIPGPVLAPVQLTNTGNWQQMHLAMEAVVHGEGGTAKPLSKGLTNYMIAGKTGTAQVAGIRQGARYDESRLNDRQYDHAWFIGFAPADHPRIAVAVLVENGKHGGSAAGPIARAMFDYAINGPSRHRQAAMVGAPGAEPGPPASGGVE